jgi:hypothetical protein
VTTAAGADGVVHEVVRDVGWPFLVSAGQVRDYGVLVAPDFLVASGEQGLLGVVGSAVEGGPVETTTVRTSTGHQLSLAYAARPLTAADVGSTDGIGTDGSSVLDEFGRPLRIVVGVVTEHPRATDPAPDLERAEATVLAAYRRFRTNEAAYRVEPSRREPMHSLGRVGLPTYPPEPPPGPRPGVGPYPGITTPQGAPYSSGGPRRTGPAILVGVAVVALMLAALFLIWPGRSTDCTPASVLTPTSAPSGTPTPTPSGTPTATPSDTPTPTPSGTPTAAAACQ